jgi:hypothetical protein
MWGFVMGKRGTGAGFPQELQFPLPIYIPSASPQSTSLSPEAGTIGQSGCSANSLTKKKKKKKNQSVTHDHQNKQFKQGKSSYKLQI